MYEMTDEQKRAELAEFVSGLRALADLYEANGVDKIPVPDYGLTVTLRPQVWRDSSKPDAKSWEKEIDPEASKALLKKWVRGMGRGRKEKKYNDYAFSCTKKLSDNVKLVVQSDREVACTPVKTGRTIVHAATVYTSPERVEEEVEWVCDDPLLAPPKSKVA